MQDILYALFEITFIAAVITVTMKVLTLYKTYLGNVNKKLDQTIAVASKESKND